MGAEKERRRPRIKKNDGFATRYRFLPIRGDPWRPVGVAAVRILRCSGMCGVVCRLGTWRRAEGGGQKRRRRSIISQKWRILVVNNNIYRPVGMRSDPWASRRFRILCLFGAMGLVCRFGTWRLSAGGPQKEIRLSRVNQKWASLVATRNIYRPVGVRSDRRAPRRCSIFAYCVRLVMYVVLVHGGWRRAGARQEGRAPRITSKLRILAVRRNIYRPVGVRSDPWASRMSRILRLFGTSGVVCRSGTWRRAPGGAPK